MKSGGVVILPEQAPEKRAARQFPDHTADHILDEAVLVRREPPPDLFPEPVEHA